MTTKADFNAAEWQTVVDGPLLAGMRVISADRGGTLRETLALNQVYQQARQSRAGTQLLDELIASPPSIDANRLREAQGNISALTQGELRKAIGTLEAKATAAEVDAYKTFVMTVAQAVASAHREGGILGLGGKEISDAENAALDEISSALGPPPQA